MKLRSLPRRGRCLRGSESSLALDEDEGQLEILLLALGWGLPALLDGPRELAVVPRRHRDLARDLPALLLQMAMEHKGAVADLARLDASVFPRWSGLSLSASSRLLRNLLPRLFVDGDLLARLARRGVAPEGAHARPLRGDELEVAIAQVLGVHLRGEERGDRLCAEPGPAHELEHRREALALAAEHRVVLHPASCKLRNNVRHAAAVRGVCLVNGQEN